jgi:predicted ATP-grasp superfamily ATP-dependent carboligase
VNSIILRDNPSLIRPILICAFGGWGDAGRAPTLAIQHLITTWNATKFGDVDSDELYDLTSSRPWVSLDADGQRRITWPSVSFFAHHDPNGEIDAILALGPEPAFRWRAFCAELVELARSYDVRMVVMLGAFPAQVSHRDAVPLTGWASPKALHERLKLLDVQPVSYEGPTNLVTVLGVAMAEAKIPVAALWAAVPAFLGATPNPKGALALLTCVDRSLDLGLDLAKLREASEEFERSVNQALRRANLSTSVAMLPAQGETTGAKADDADTSTADEAPELPPAEDVVRLAEDLLRQNREP